MSVDNIVSLWKKKQFQPLYLFHGEEDFFIDTLVAHAEAEILDPSQTAFDLMVFYGKDADWAQVINACRRFPMLGDKQLVILKEAQMMDKLDKLEPYLEHPQASTIFIIAYKGKTLDKRLRVYKLLNQSALIYESKPVGETGLPGWIQARAEELKLAVSHKAVQMLADHVGNDLSRMDSELQKLALNREGRTEIDEELVERYVGISREYNVFELQNAIIRKDLAAALTVIRYFGQNPREFPIQKILPALYSFYSKVYAAYGLDSRSEQALKAHFYNSYPALKQGQALMKAYGYQGVEKLILLLHQYSLKGVGVGDAGTEDESLMREMVAKMLRC